jgi:PTS system nitrogen regulatory IIA component
MALTVREAARLLSTTDDQVHRWIESGEIPFDRANDQLRLNRSELLEWATARKVPLSTEAFREEGERRLSLAAALRLGGVHHDVPGGDRAAVLHAIVERLPIPDPADRELAEGVLLAREQLGSSAVGDGIAIPHVRHPLVFHAGAPIVALSFLARPLEFGAPDGKPVFAMFTMISPTIRMHLQLLARLAASLHDAEFKAAIVGRAPAETILREVDRVEASLSGLITR